MNLSTRNQRNTVKILMQRGYIEPTRAFKVRDGDILLKRKGKADEFVLIMPVGQTMIGTKASIQRWIGKNPNTYMKFPERL